MLSPLALATLWPTDQAGWAGVGAITAAAICLTLGTIAQRRRLPRAGFATVAALIVLVVATIAWCSPRFALVGWHGFMHAAPIYQVITRADAGLPTLPPEEPLFAGGELRYPWAMHWAIAQLCRLTGFGSHTLTIGIELAALLTMLLAAGWVAFRIESTTPYTTAAARAPLTACLAVLVTATGIGIVHGGPLAAAISRAFPTLALEPRIVPVDKFANISAMPVGFAAAVAAFALALALLSRTAPRPRWLGAALLALALLTVVAALVHPLSWLGLIGMQAAAGAAALLTARPGTFRPRLTTSAWIALTIAAATAACWPYLRAVGAGESSDGSLGLTRSEFRLWTKAADLALLLLVAAPALYAARSLLIRDWFPRRVAPDSPRAAPNLIAVACLLCVLGFAFAYLVAGFPGRNEYKFLIYLTPAAAALTARALAALWPRQPLLVLVSLALMAWPGASVLSVRPGFATIIDARQVGPNLRAVDPALDELMLHLADKTRPDCVVIAVDLLAPALGRRSLYIAVDAPWRGRDGWGLARQQLLQWHIRRADPVMYRRQSLATIVLNADWAQPPGIVMDQIAADVPGRSIIVISTWPATTAKLRATPGFVERFTNSAGSVFEWTAPSPAATPTQERQ